MKRYFMFSVLLFVATPALASPLCGNNVRCQQADKELNQVWQGLNKAEQNAFREMQKRWMDYRDKTCGTDADCLADSTQKRADSLRDITSCINNPNKVGCRQE